MLVLAMISVVSVGLVVGLYLGAVRTAAGQRADEAAMIGRSTHHVVQDTATDLLDTITVTSLGIAVVGLGVLALSRRRPRLAVGVGLMVLGANVTTQMLKSTFLSRPDLLHRPEAASVASFPSGHATVAMAMGLGFMLVVPARLRTVAGLIGITYATLIGAGTLTAQWHRPSDVIAAYLVVTAWVAVLVICLVMFRGTGRSLRRRPMFLAGLVPTGRLVVWGALLIAAALAVSMIVALIVDGGPRVSVPLGGAYLAAIAAMAGTGLVIVGSLLWAFRGALLDPPAADQQP